MLTITFVAVFLAGFAGGWAFFKHRAGMKAAVQAEEKKLRDAAVRAANKI